MTTAAAPDLQITVTESREYGSLRYKFVLHAPKLNIKHHDCGEVEFVSARDGINGLNRELNALNSKERESSSEEPSSEEPIESSTNAQEIGRKSIFTVLSERVKENLGGDRYARI